MRVVSLRLVEAVVIRGFVSRMSAAAAVLSVVLLLSGAERTWGQAAPGVAPGRRPATRPAASTAPADPNAPKLRCDELIHDFGEVWSGEQVEHAYVIHNDGKSPLELLNVRPSCGCTVVDFDKVIAPGGQGKVTVKLSTVRMAHEVSKTVMVESNDPLRRSITLTLKGKVKPRISVEPASAAFGSVTDRGTELVRKIKVTNHTEEPMKLQRMPLPPGQKTVFQAEVAEVEPGKVAEITVRVAPPIPEGSSSLLLRFQTGIEKEKEIPVTCSLYSPPLVQVMPMLLPVTLPVPENFQRWVSIVYNGKDDFVIEKPVPGNDAISVELVPSSPQPPRPAPGTPPNAPAPARPQSYRLNVRIDPRFNPPTEDPIDIVMKTNLKEKPEIKVAVKPTRVKTPPARPPQTPVVARPEELLGKPCPVTSFLSAGSGQALQLGTGGQVAMLNFWAAWSAQSRQQAAAIQSLSTQFFRKGVTFVNVSVDSLKPVSEITKAAQSFGLAPGTVAADPHYVTAARFGVKSVPTLILVGKSGMVEAIHEGLPGPEQVEAYEEMLKSEIDLLLEGRNRAEFASIPKTAGLADAMEAQAAGVVSPGPRLTIESTRQDIGAVNPASEVSANVYVRNDGRQPLSITSVTASEGLAIDSGYPRALQPGATGALACRFTAAGQPSSFGHKVTIASNDTARPRVEITLVGAVKPYLEVQPKTGIDFGRNPRTQTMERMATILYNGPNEPAIEYLSAESSSPKFAVRVKRLGTSNNAMLTVTPNGPFDLGELTAVAKVKTTSEPQPTLDVPIRLYNPKRVEVTPEAVVLQGAARTQRYSITIANNGFSDLHILGVTKSNSSIRTQFYPDSDGFSYRLEVMLPVNYAMAAGGDKITIRTDDKEFGEIVIPIRSAAGG